MRALEVHRGEVHFDPLEVQTRQHSELMKEHFVLQVFLMLHFDPLEVQCTEVRRFDFEST